MTDAQKLLAVKTILQSGSDEELPSDDVLNTYLTMAGSEILSWMYHLVGGVPSGVTAVPAKYEQRQIYAVVAGYTHAGAEGESSHHENGVVRHFRYSDMIDYIQNYVLAISRVGAIS